MGSFDLKDLACMRFEPHEEERYGLKTGDLVVCEGGEPGRCAIWHHTDSGMKIQKALHRIRGKPGLDINYLYYWFRLAGMTGILEPYFTGTTIKHLTGRALAELKIPLPPIGMQRMISQTLGALDEKIELNRRMNETLEAMAQAIFRDWFIDFGPVRRKLAGVADPVEIMGGLAPHPDEATNLAALFPDALCGEELPRGWSGGELGDLAKSVGVGVDPTRLAEDTPYIGLEHMPRRSIALSNWAVAGKVTSQKSQFTQGNILFGKLRPYFHKVGLAPIDGVCSTDIIVLDSREPFDHALVLSCVSSDAFVAFADQSSTGTKMPRTSWPHMKSFPLAIAPALVRRAYSLLVAPMHERVASSVMESRTLAEIRDYLLPRLMSEEVRVSDLPSEAAA